MNVLFVTEKFAKRNKHGTGGIKARLRLIGLESCDWFLTKYSSYDKLYFAIVLEVTFLFTRLFFQVMLKIMIFTLLSSAVSSVPDFCLLPKEPGNLCSQPGARMFYYDPRYSNCLKRQSELCKFRSVPAFSIQWL